MNRNPNNVSHLILQLAGLVSGEDFIGNCEVDKRLSVKLLREELKNRTHEDFGSDIREWVTWYRDNHDLSSEEQTNLQFAIVSAQIKKIKNNKHGKK